MIGLLTWLSCTTALSGGPYTASDFSEYCEMTDALLSSRDPLFHQRTWLTAQIYARSVSLFGVMDGFAFIAIICSIFLAYGLYLWGEAVRGPAAGTGAALLGIACLPIAVLSRTLSFYPLIISSTVLASGMMAKALVRPTWLLPAGWVLAATALCDVRNALWAMVGFPILFLAALQQRRWIVSILLLFMLGVSWKIGERTWFHTPDTLLEHQLHSLVNDSRRYAGMSPVEDCGPRGFVWGHATDISGTYACVQRLQSSFPSLAELSNNNAWRWATLGQPWLILILLSIPLVLFGIFQDRSAFFPLLLPMIPFFSAFQVALLDPNLRRVGAALGPIPVIVSLGWTVLLEGEPRRKGLPASLLFVIGIFVLKLGFPPSLLGPRGAA